MKKVIVLLIVSLLSLTSLSVATCPNDEIWYTSTDENVVTPYSTNVFGAYIISNTYSGGKGVIKFNGNVTSIESYAFQNCKWLQELYVNWDTPCQLGQMFLMVL